MSDYHVLAASENGFNIRVAFHIPVPGGTNIVNKSYATCLLESKQATLTSQVSGLAQAELDALAAGTLIEVLDSIEVRFNSGDPESEIRARGKAAIEDKFNRIKTKRQIQIPLMFRYWGYKGDVS